MPPSFVLVVSEPWASLVPSYVSAGLRLKVLFILSPFETGYLGGYCPHRGASKSTCVLAP